MLEVARPLPVTVTLMSKKRYYLTILVLGSLTAVVPFSIDMYLPGFPAIAKEFNTSVAQVSLSLSSFFIGVSVGQLLYGPLLDRFGRKRPLYAGLVVYLITSLACTMVQSLDALILLRFLQAIGACAAMVTAYAMVRDLFPVEDNAKIFSMLMLVLSTSPLIAPTAGGYMTASLGWHSVFIALAGIVVLILIGIRLVLPESSKPDPTYSLRPSAIIGNFISVVKQPQFFTYSLTGAIGFSGLFVYIASSPFVFMELFKVSEQTYGWIFALLASGVILATQVNRLLLKYFRSAQIVFAGLIAQSVIGVLFLLLTVNGWIGITGTIVLLFLFLSCVGLLLPNSSALCMQPFSKNAGSASALMGALQMGIGSLATVVVSLFHAVSAVPMAIVMAGCALIALSVLLSSNRITRLGFWQQPDNKVAGPL